MSVKNFASGYTMIGTGFRTFFLRPLSIFIGILLVFPAVFLSAQAVAKTIRIDILMDSNTRQAAVDGLRHALAQHAYKDGNTYIFTIKNNALDPKSRKELAEEIIADKPDVAVAAGGIEADALLIASTGTNIPVVFLSVSSAIDRGMVASMVSSGNNLTGIDTNDTNLTAKRLWFIRKILPEAKKVFCFHVPSSVPSVEALAVARQSASDLDFELQAVEVESQGDIKKATAALSKNTTDVILLLPTFSTNEAMHTIIFPKAIAEKIPIFGFSETNINSGAFASYAGSRYANGEQAARMIRKIVNGTAPRDIPIETPNKLELVINKDVVAQLGLKVSDRVWRMADRIVDIKIQSYMRRL
jgi:putative tryptophan/tyrosine transport system substrate-binding protein